MTDKTQRTLKETNDAGVIMSKDIDHDKVLEYRVVDMRIDTEGGCKEMNSLLKKGWKLFWIQTELDYGGVISPSISQPQFHATRAYLARM